MQVADETSFGGTPKNRIKRHCGEAGSNLGEKFFAAITAYPVPVDMRALRALKRSPLALDLYAWLSYEAYPGAQQRQGPV